MFIMTRTTLVKNCWWWLVELLAGPGRPCKKCQTYLARVDSAIRQCTEQQAGGLDCVPCLARPGARTAVSTLISGDNCLTSLYCRLLACRLRPPCRPPCHSQTARGRQHRRHKGLLSSYGSPWWSYLTFNFSVMYFIIKTARPCEPCTFEKLLNSLIS